MFCSKKVLLTLTNCLVCGLSLRCFLTSLLRHEDEIVSVWISTYAYKAIAFVSKMLPQPNCVFTLSIDYLIVLSCDHPYITAVTYTQQLITAVYFLNIFSPIVPHRKEPSNAILLFGCIKATQSP